MKPAPGQITDLVAINIQRGRDHGLPPYVDFRNHFKQNRAAKIRWKLQQKLKQLYGAMNRVDLYVGGLLEEIEEGAHMGPTFSRILAELFK